MRLPRLRFIVRGLMIAVAVAAGVAWGERMRRISEGHRQRARHFQVVPVNISSGGMPESPEEQAKLAEIERREWEKIRNYYEAMQAKYERAARYPWLPVAPEPEE